ncbi:hypothetical protein [Aeromicrobium sp.]|uniref:hypothetical protein n=1 Tax=Aeromicrobium sp. TaxID=1871063 RepID=UPI0030BD344C
MNLLKTSRTNRTPTDLLLNGALVVAPLLYLLVDCLYAARGWEDPDAGALHALGAIAYAFVLVRIATWTHGWLAAWTLFVGIVGAAGNMAYGFNTIHVALGGVDLVDTSGPGAIIKPLGLFFPVSLVLAAVVLRRLGVRLAAVSVAVAAVLWPVAHIGNIAGLAVAVNVLLVLAFVPLAWKVWPQSDVDRHSGTPEVFGRIR